jgi:hypothetical protein
MKKYNGLLIVKTGSQALCKKVQQGKTLDLILICEKLSYRNDLRIGKKISKTGKTAQYYNKYWRLGILDSDLVSCGYLIESNGSLLTSHILEDDLRVVRNKNLASVFHEIMKKQGIFRMIYILALFMLSGVLNKYRTFL